VGFRGVHKHSLSGIFWVTSGSSFSLQIWMPLEHYLNFSIPKP
jgi:hypothetical protein